MESEPEKIWYCVLNPLTLQMGKLRPGDKEGLGQGHRSWWQGHVLLWGYFLRCCLARVVALFLPHYRLRAFQGMSKHFCLLSPEGEESASGMESSEWSYKNKHNQNRKTLLSAIFFFFFFKIFFFFFRNSRSFIYLFMTVLCLRFCARAFSSCSKWGPLFIAVRGPLTIVASHHRGLSCCGAQAPDAQAQ